jgi:hypothetical protein
MISYNPEITLMVEGTSQRDWAHSVRAESKRLVLPRQNGLDSGSDVVVVLIYYYYYKRSDMLCNPLGYPLDEQRYDP